MVALIIKLHINGIISNTELYVKKLTEQGYVWKRKTILLAVFIECSDIYSYGRKSTFIPFAKCYFDNYNIKQKQTKIKQQASTVDNCNVIKASSLYMYTIKYK